MEREDINDGTTLTPLEQQPPGVILQVAPSFSHTLVLTDQGLYTSEYNSCGQLGLGHTNACTTLTGLEQQPPGVILQVVVGESNTTLVLTDQGLHACGDNSYGQLGLGHTNPCTTLTRLEQQPPGVILQVVVGKLHTLVLTDQGLYACGDNSYGQLELGHTNACTTLTRLPQQPSGIILQAVTSASHTHSLVLTDQGLYAFAVNRSLGLRHTNARTTLTLVNQVPSELQQFQALYRQLNALIRLSQTESPLSQPETSNPRDNSLPKA